VLEIKEKNMICDVILRKEAGRYIARAKDYPDVIVEENSREKAIDLIRIHLLNYLTKDTELIQVEVPLQNSVKNPWIENFGCFRDDPGFEDLQAEIAAYRQEIDKDEFSI
jgi:hypothetical protein